MASSASSAHSRSTSRAWSSTGWARSRASASSTSASSSIGPDSSSRRRADAGSVVRDSSSAGSVATPSRRSVPGVLPDWPVSLDDVEQVVGELEGDADALAVAGEDLGDAPRRRRPASRRTAPRWRSASRSCRRARAGSARAGRRPRSGPTVSRIWPWTSRSNVRAWMRTHSGPRSARMSEARANRKSPVRIAMRVAPAGVGADRAAPDERPRPSRRRGRASPGGSARRRPRPGRRPAQPASPNWAASRTSSGRNRLPPASTRCSEVSVTNG